MRARECACLPVPDVCIRVDHIRLRVVDKHLHLRVDQHLWRSWNAVHQDGDLKTRHSLAVAAQLVRASVWVLQAHNNKPLDQAFIAVSRLPEAPPQVWLGGLGV